MPVNAQICLCGFGPVCPVMGTDWRQGRQKVSAPSADSEDGIWRGFRIRFHFLSFDSHI